MHGADVTWEEGKQICVELGGMIVVPQSKEDLQHILNMFSSSNFWIGCNDLDAEGTWVCFGEGTIDVQDKRWQDGQPDGGDDCAEGWAGGWHDGGCGATRTLICQRPVAPEF
ncbi:C-type lectin domain family 4 member M-like [Asterias amurensis]|uniref:C-type lectin domain family 4 member M-like n=1 Tax=Asterias amurensis TaxID=7602 RepID=UPI003AB43A07